MYCESCHQERECLVYSSPFFPTSNASCQECLDHGAICTWEIKIVLGRYFSELEGFQDLSIFPVYGNKTGYTSLDKVFIPSKIKPETHEELLDVYEEIFGRLYGT